MKSIGKIKKPTLCNHEDAVQFSSVYSAYSTSDVSAIYEDTVMLFIMTNLKNHLALCPPSGSPSAFAVWPAPMKKEE